MTESLVEVRDLTKYFYEQDGLLDRLLGAEPVAVKAVDGLDFDIARGETLGIVGESGCGKSTAGETLLWLQEPTAGTVRFDGESVSEMDRTALTELRRRAGIVFQDPFSSLDPRMTIGATVKQPLDVHDWPDDRSDDSADALRRERVKELLERVGLSGDQFDRYPHEFSGGQRQRIGIARALALDPDFLVLDEPTSALDVSVQAQILNLLADLQAEFDLTYLLISHDLSVIRHICDRVAVMYLGEIVEIGPSEELFSDPKHPYTQALLESVPRVDLTEREREIEPLSGDVPSPRDPPSGCRFRTRCPQVIPPEGSSLSQEQFRTVMNVRDRIAAREIGVEKAELAVDETVGESADECERHDALADELYDRLVDVRLPADDRKQLEAALAVAADGQWDDADEQLRERYETVCETTAPDGERAACHLVDDQS